MTKYDEGQLLITASDCLFSCADQLRSTQPKYAETLEDFARCIGDIFNKHGSHEFSIRGSFDGAIKK
jgi:hypothetical protein